MTLDVHVRNGRTFLATKLFLPGRANGLGVVFSHGWGGAHLFDDLHAFLADTGVTVASMDQRGYGQSSGKAVLAKWPEYATADALTWTARIAPRPVIVVHARGDEVVPFAHAEMIRDTGGARLWDFPGGDHRLQTIDRPALFERIRQALTAA
ncbi:MAG: hypothetical protein HYW08_11685 [candidate division NC10 bacterium]|nr:hypothetical protein [candidate division NC10 bacterium]